MTIDHTRYCWVFPLKRKSEAATKIQNFLQNVATQFNTTVKAFQCDGGREYDNLLIHNFLDSHGVQSHTCPHTHQPNGAAEHMHRTIANMVPSFLFQASRPSHQHLEQFWVVALHVSIHTLNLLPRISLHSKSLFTLLFHKQPSYQHLHVFGCACDPNLTPYASHKLAPRSALLYYFGLPILLQGLQMFECSNKSNHNFSACSLHFLIKLFSKKFEPTDGGLSSIILT